MAAATVLYWHNALVKPLVITMNFYIANLPYLRVARSNNNLKEKP